MSRTDTIQLSRRERQIMDSIYQRGRATAAEVQEDLPEPPSYSAVRAMLAILVSKDALKIEKDGPRYVYLPTKPRHQAGRSAIKQVLETFYGGSVEAAVAALLDASDARLSKEEVARLQDMIEKSKMEGK